MLELDGSILVVMILFAVLTWIVGRLYLRPIDRMLSERHEATVGLQEQARELRAEAERQTRSYQHGLQQARLENYRQQEEARRQALEDHQKLLHEARGKYDHVLTEAKQQITAQVTHAKEWIRKEAETLSTEVVNQFLN
ncbi:MAG: ATP synthase F0 subunit B [Acidobacteriia bacterium]|nr:ATP synthase F0 subunit B [Terriglobia bacterium]